MASTTLNFVDTANLLGEFVSILSPERYIENIEDTLAVTDTFTEIHTERPIVNLVDDLAIGEIIGIVAQNVFVLDFEDSALLNDEFSEDHTLRTVLLLDDVLVLVDDTLITSTDRADLDLVDAVSLIDAISVKGTDRFERILTDTAQLLDTFAQEYGIKIELPISGGGVGLIDGLSFGSFLAGVEAQLSTSLNPNVIFHRWDFSKSGIANIYDPNSTIIVPAGGGSITPILINLGAIIVPFNSLILVTDPNHLEYNKDIDGDFISTEEKTEVAGDAVSVAISNLTIEQGSTFQRIVTYRNVNGDPVNLTGYTAEMQIRKTKESSTILLTLSTSNGLLILGGASGTVTINIPGITTDTLDFIWGRYDLELYPNGDTTIGVRLLEGKVNLSKQVTQ